MKRSVYNIISVIKEIHDSIGEYPGKTKFQKIVYLIENIGNVPLGYQYEIHLYGPYSAKLDESVTKLIGEGILYYSFEDNSHLIKLREDPTDDKLFAPDLTNTELGVVKDIARRFASKSPSDLELLTTTHYVIHALDENSCDNIIAGVQKIKGMKFSDTQIGNAINEIQTARQKLIANVTDNVITENLANLAIDTQNQISSDINFWNEFDRLAESASDEILSVDDFPRTHFKRELVVFDDEV